MALPDSSPRSGGFVLVFLHRSFAWVACRSHAFGKLIKGFPDTIVENGKPLFDMMRRNLISQHDLEEDLRLDAKVEDIRKSSGRALSAAAISASSRTETGAPLVKNPLS
jgi:hypothetical protein